jgi:hypothetical protein
MAFVSKVTAERRDLRELGHAIQEEAAVADGDVTPRRPHRMPLGVEASGAFATYVRCCAVVIVDMTMTLAPAALTATSTVPGATPAAGATATRSIAPAAGGEAAGGGAGAAAPVASAPQTLDGARTRELWMGDRDGGILIATANDGSPARFADGSARAINQFPGTFPTAVGQVTFRDVWVCFQDGMIRAFDIASLHQRFELKRHCGAVTGIEVVESANIVATCSEDFLIYLWEGPPRSRQSAPTTALPRLITKFSGHTNYVRAMCASPSGQHLFTGAADGTVRCYDLVRHVALTVTDVVEANAAVLGRGSGGAATGRVIYDGASGQSQAVVLPCTRNARDVFYLFLLDVGTMLGVVTKTAVTIFVVATSAVHCVFEANNAAFDKSVTFVAALFCESTGMLWVSRSDGLVAVYDLHTFELAGVVDAHMNTVVQLVQFATCAATVRVVAAAADSICGKDSSSEVQASANKETRDDMRKLVGVFRAQRTLREASERDLATQRRQLGGLARYDAQFRARVAAALERADRSLVVSRALQRSRFFVLKRKHQNQSQLCAVAMENSSRALLRSRYMHDWFRFWCSRRTDEAKRSVQGAVTRLAERSLQSRYTQRALQTLRRALLVEALRRRATLFANVVELRARRRVFALWRRWMLYRTQAARAADFASMSLRYNAALARSVAWTGLYSGAHNARTQEVRKRLATAVASLQNLALLRNGYDALLAAAKRRARRRNRALAATKLQQITAARTRGAVLGAFARFVRERRQRALAVATERLDSRLRDLSTWLEDPDVGALTPDEVSRRITATEIEVQAATAALAQLKARLESVDASVASARGERDALELGATGRAAPAAAPAPSSSTSATTTAAASLVHESELQRGLDALAAHVALDIRDYATAGEKLRPGRSGSARAPAAAAAAAAASGARAVSPARRAPAATPRGAKSPAPKRAPSGAPPAKRTAAAPAGKRAPSPTGKRAPSPAGKRALSSSPGSRPASRAPSPQPPGAAAAEDARAATSLLLDAVAAALAAYPSPAAAPAAVAAPAPADGAPAPLTVEGGVAAAPEAAAPAAAPSAPAAVDQSWAAQRELLLGAAAATDAPATLTEAQRSAWATFASFVANATRAVTMWQVLRHASARSGEAVGDAARSRWTALGDQLAREPGVAELVARLSLARAHPALTQPPPAPKPPVQPTATTPRTSPGGARAAAPGGKRATSPGGKRATSPGGKRATSPGAPAGGTARPAPKAAAKPAAKRAASPAAKPAAKRAASARPRA